MYSVIMIRTQVSLRDDEYAAAKAEAAAAGDLARRTVEAVTAPHATANPAGTLDAVFRIPAVGRPPVSERIDEVVYAEKP